MCVCARVWELERKRERERERESEACIELIFIFLVQRSKFFEVPPTPLSQLLSQRRIRAERRSDTTDFFFFSRNILHTWLLGPLSLSYTHSYSHISLFLFIRVCVHEQQQQQQQQQGEEEAAAGDSNDRAAMRWEFGSKARETKISIQVTHRAQSRRRAEASFPFFKWCHWNDNLFRRQQKRTRLLLLKKTSLIITTEWPFRDFHKKEDQEEEKGGIILSPEVTRSLRRLIR